MDQNVPLLKSNLLTSVIGREVKMGSYWGYVMWDSIPGRSYQDKQAQAEPRLTLAGYGEILVLQQDECGLCSRRILSLRSMVYTIRCWVDELLQNQPTAKINQFSQRTTATICSTDKHSWYQLLKDQKTNWTTLCEKLHLCYKYIFSRISNHWLHPIGFFDVSVNYLKYIFTSKIKKI